MIIATTDELILGVFDSKEKAVEVLGLDVVVDDGLWMSPDSPDYGRSETLYYYRGVEWTSLIPVTPNEYSPINI
jgi:hypothetical protein